MVRKVKRIFRGDAARKIRCAARHNIQKQTTPNR
jgi:hypothetical protein